jgi:hypothetical protein
MFHALMLAERWLVWDRYFCTCSGEQKYTPLRDKASESKMYKLHVLHFTMVFCGGCVCRLLNGVCMPDLTKDKTLNTPMNSLNTSHIKSVKNIIVTSFRINIIAYCALIYD